MERLPGCQPNKAICHGCRPNASHTLTHNLASEIVGLRPLRLLSLPPFPRGPSSPLSVFPFSILAAFSFHVLFPHHVSKILSDSALSVRPSTPHSSILKNTLLTEFLRIYIYIETYDDSFSNWRTVSKNLSLRLTLEYIYIYIQALNRRMNQIETFSFPPTFLIYILLARSNEFTLYTTRKQYYLGRVLSWRRNGRPDYYAVFAP